MLISLPSLRPWAAALAVSSAPVMPDHPPVFCQANQVITQAPMSKMTVWIVSVMATAANPPATV